MAFDKTQPYATINTDLGKSYYLQSGTIYQSWDLAVANPPLPENTAFYVQGNVGLTTLLAGENQTDNWMMSEDGATHYQQVLPLPNAVAGGLVPNSSVVLGTLGATGDYLKTLIVSIRNTTNASVFIQDGAIANILSGTTGTNPAGTTTLAVTASGAFTATANQYAGYVVSVTYTPTGSASGVEIWTRIATHAAVAASTAVSWILDHAIPAGATITAWSLKPTSCREIIPFNTPIGVYQFKYGKQSVNGGFKISVDSGVQVEAIGLFT